MGKEKPLIVISRIFVGNLKVYISIYNIYHASIYWLLNVYICTIFHDILICILCINFLNI